MSPFGSPFDAILLPLPANCHLIKVNSAYGLKLFRQQVTLLHLIQLWDLCGIVHVGH